MNNEIEHLLNNIKNEMMKTADEVIKLNEPLPDETLEDYFERLNDAIREICSKDTGDSLIDSLAQTILEKTLFYIQSEKRRAIDSMPAREILKLK